MSIADSIAAGDTPDVAAPCTHCGLDVPPDRVRGASASFCCNGCETAWHVLHASGLEGYYALPERRRTAVAERERSYEEFDHASFHERYVRTARGVSEVDLYLEGVHCAACVWLVERLPRFAHGAIAAELELPRSRVRVRWDPTATALSSLARALDEIGYRPHPFRGVRAEAMRRDEDRAMLSRIGVAGAITANAMMVAVALWAGWFSGIEGEHERYLRWSSFALATPALIWPGSVFFRSALGALRARRLHMDVPIALALGAGWLQGVVNTVRGEGPIYFDGLSMLVFLLLVGRFLQTRAQRAAADSAELLHAFAPSSSRVVEGDAVRETPSGALLPGMLVEVRPGESFPADGVVESGETDLDLSFLSGESRPQSAGPGTPVFAGAVNRTSTVRARVEVAGEETRVGRMLRAVEEGAQRRAPVVRLADSLSGRFVAAVLALAALTAAIWLVRDPARSVDAAIAVLIVTCPCALALATPLAVTVAIGRAASLGILVKGGDALEALSKPLRMVLDKTGTLTLGRTSLAAWEGPDDVRPLVLALERDAAHPVARGFLEAWPDVRAADASDVRHFVGGGIEGRAGGRVVVVGSPAFVSARARGGFESPFGATWTPVWVAVDGRVVARAGFGDPVRDDSAAALARLRERGFALEMLSGDDPSVARSVGAALGFEPGSCRGGATPEDKLAEVERAADAGPVAMVGDGLNDAAALARATVGIAVRGGAEACAATADVYLSEPGIAPLVTLVDGARRTLGVIRANIVFSLVYNAVGVALAMAGLIHPIVAALLMPASSLTVVLVSWLAPTFRGVKR